MKPQQIRLHRKSGTLELGYADGASYELTAEYLRVHSPSAEVQGHGPGQRTLQEGKRDVRINDIEPQGNYAIKLCFSDGHDSGIFTWTYLYELATRHDELWNSYLRELEAAGKSRNPRFIAISR